MNFLLSHLKRFVKYFDIKLWFLFGKNDSWFLAFFNESYDMPWTIMPYFWWEKRFLQWPNNYNSNAVIINIKCLIFSKIARVFHIPERNGRDFAKHCVIFSWKRTTLHYISRCIRVLWTRFFIHKQRISNKYWIMKFDRTQSFLHAHAQSVQNNFLHWMQFLRHLKYSNLWFHLKCSRLYIYILPR